MVPLFTITLAILLAQQPAQRPDEMYEIYRLLELSPKRSILPSDLEAMEKVVRSGSVMGVRLAQHLRRFAPLRVSAALEEGAQRSDDAMICLSYYRELGEPGTPEVSSMLARDMRNAKELWRAWAAGSVLLPFEPVTVATAMADRLSETVGTDSKVSEHDIQRLDLILLRTGQGKAIRALSDNIAQFSTLRKRRLLFSFGNDAFVKGKARHDWSRSPAEVREFQTEVERLLALELNDTEPTQGAVFHIGQDEFVNPRMCDLASLALSELFPSKYWFRSYGETRNRDYMRWLNLRTWEGK